MDILDSIRKQQEKIHLAEKNLRRMKNGMIGFIQEKVLEFRSRVAMVYAITATPSNFEHACSHDVAYYCTFEDANKVYIPQSQVNNINITWKYEIRQVRVSDMDDSAILSIGFTPGDYPYVSNLVYVPSESDSEE